jgi:hypothetical protein
LPERKKGDKKMKKSIKKAIAVFGAGLFALPAFACGGKPETGVGVLDIYVHGYASDVVGKLSRRNGRYQDELRKLGKQWVLV